METIVSDIRYAVRNLLSARGFTIVALVTLALGIGAPTAMFTVVNALLLRPLPFRAPDQLVALGEFDTRHQGAPVSMGTLSYPDFADVRARNHSFEAVAVYQENTYTATGIGQPLHVGAENVSANLFDLLGPLPVLGRTFLPEEDQPGHHVVILSDAFWRAHFNADPSALGRSITLAGRPFTIIGVMPRGFQFPIRAEARDMWLTFSRVAEADDPADQPSTAQRGNHSLTAIARLKPGLTLARVNAELASIAHALSTEYANSNSHTGIGARPELENLIGDTRKPILILLYAVGLVLLIACANVANLLLGRGSARSREIAIRAALGASRARVVRQLVTESVVLSVVGAPLGIGVAAWTLAAILHLYPTNLPRAQEIGIDFRVVLFTAALALLTGIFFGLVPALRVSAPNLTDAMREGGRSSTTGQSHTRLRSGLVIAETAFGVMLLIGAGLFIRSLDRLSHARLGFDPGHLLTASFDLSETAYNSDQQDRFVNDLVTRLRALPGVTAAAGSLPLPLNNDGWSISFNLVEHPLPEANQPSAGFYVVVPGFFETMQIPLVRGRTFGERDRRNEAPVMIITDSFARKFFPTEDPIGKRIEIGAGEGAARARYKTREIVGVVGDIRTGNLAKAPVPAYYIPLPQLMWGAPTLVIRTAGDPQAVASGVRQVLSSMDPTAPLYEVRPMDDYLALDLGRARFQTALLGFFAGVALLLTAVGLYGVIAFAVAQRTHEIGIRVALGASRSDVLRMVLTRGIALTLAGIAIGVFSAAALSRLVQSLLYETPPLEPLTYCVVCAILSSVALLASYVPARRAMRVDPMVALRYD
jgi:putative ABC transport system permease protein